MINLLNLLSKLLAVIPLGMFLYDAVKSWFVDAHFRLRSLRAWWTWLDAKGIENAKPFLLQVITQKQLDQVLAAPGALVMLVLPLAFYILYRLFFALAGGKSAGGITYKSRH